MYITKGAYTTAYSQRSSYAFWHMPLFCEDARVFGFEQLCSHKAVVHGHPLQRVYSLELSRCRESVLAQRFSALRYSLRPLGSWAIFTKKVPAILGLADQRTLSAVPSHRLIKTFDLALVNVSTLFTGIELSGRQRPALSLVLYGLKNRIRGVFLMPRHVPGGRGEESQEVLTELSATSVASMFGYSRRYQRAHFIRLSFIKYLRRYVLILAQLRANLGVVGVMRQFKGYFRALNLPTNQVYTHPLTGKWVSDVALILPAKQRAPIARTELTCLVQSMMSEHMTALNESAPDAAISAIVPELVNFFWRLSLNGSRLWSGTQPVFHRYRLSWDQVSFKKGAAHGFKRAKRARSIKKRRSKRLITKTKFRFWTM